MTMQLVEQHIISKADPRFAPIDAAAFAAKNLYNAANYLVRQAFIFEHHDTDTPDQPLSPYGEQGGNRAPCCRGHWHVGDRQELALEAESRVRPSQ
jgi:hypothetical protein